MAACAPGGADPCCAPEDAEIDGLLQEMADDPTMAQCCVRDLKNQKRSAALKRELLKVDPSTQRHKVAQHVLGAPPPPGAAQAAADSGDESSLDGGDGGEEDPGERAGGAREAAWRRRGAPGAGLCAEARMHAAELAQLRELRLQQLRIEADQRQQLQRHGHGKLNDHADAVAHVSCCTAQPRGCAPSPAAAPGSSGPAAAAMRGMHRPGRCCSGPPCPPPRTWHAREERWREAACRCAAAGAQEVLTAQDCPVVCHVSVSGLPVSAGGAPSRRPASRSIRTQLLRPHGGSSALWRLDAAPRAPVHDCATALPAGMRAAGRAPGGPGAQPPAGVLLQGGGGPRLPAQAAARHRRGAGCAACVPAPSCGCGQAPAVPGEPPPRAARWPLLRRTRRAHGSCCCAAAAAALVCLRGGSIVGRAPLSMFGTADEVYEEQVRRRGSAQGRAAGRAAAARALPVAAAGAQRLAPRAAWAQRRRLGSAQLRGWQHLWWQP
jgi:hypothetical protein